MSDDSKPQPSFQTPDDPLAQVALQWVARKDRGLDPAETRALTNWLALDARHVEAFARASALWRRLNGLGEVKSLAAEADALFSKVKAKHARRRGLRLAFSTIGLAAAVVFAFIQLRPSLRPSRAEQSVAAKGGYHVVESTARRQILPDGSIVELNGSSGIEVDFTPSERRVRLVAGEAHFFVAKDKVHPFLVSANGVTVRAVGTAFNVRLAAASIEVLVTEGKIRVNNTAAAPAAVSSGIGSAEDQGGAALEAGQRAIVPTEAQSEISVEIAAAADIDQALAWQSTRLVFDHTSLSEVVEAFNRYNAHQLVLGASELKARTLTGVFRADNLDGFLRLLRASVDVVPERRSESETVLLPAK